MCEFFGLAEFTEATALDQTPLADLLCISESRYALLYLVPKALARDENELMDSLYSIYRKALRDVISQEYPPAEMDEGRSKKSLLDFLNGDVSRALRRDSAGSEGMLTPNEAELFAGLEHFLPDFAIENCGWDAWK